MELFAELSGVDGGLFAGAEPFFVGAEVGAYEGSGYEAVDDVEDC